MTCWWTAEFCCWQAIEGEPESELIAIERVFGAYDRICRFCAGPLAEFTWGNSVPTAEVGQNNKLTKAYPIDVGATMFFYAGPMEACRREGALSRIALIIPCDNYGRFLYLCVDNVLGQAGIDVRALGP
jgi:hypothetical protein